MRDALSTYPLHLTLPADRAVVAQLTVGTYILLSGAVYTMRDVGHMRAINHLRECGSLPHGLEGQTLFYAGPTPPAAGRPLGSIGPTTASRMDFATPDLFAAGIVATIGKGARSQEVHDACKRYGSVYFAAVGGAAALLATCVLSSKTVAWDELGTEALRMLELKDFPVFVAIDARGESLYEQVAHGGGTHE